MTESTLLIDTRYHTHIHTHIHTHAHTHSLVISHHDTDHHVAIDRFKIQEGHGTYDMFDIFLGL